MIFEEFYNKIQSTLVKKEYLNKEELSFKFEKYYEILVEENEKYNLTAITKKEEVYLKHFYDSICLLNYMNLDGLKVMDIGSGAGFPGVPLAIICKNTEFYLCEPTTKRANFLEMVAKELNLENVKVINKRAEELSRDFREYFDVVTSRAVSDMNILMELSIPFVKINSYFIPYKGSTGSEQVNLGKSAAIKLSAKYEKMESYEIDENLCRTLIFYKKTKKTPLKYPRNYSLIKSKSL